MRPKSLALLAATLLLALTGAAPAQITIVDNQPGAFEDISGDPMALEINLGSNDEFVYNSVVGNALLPAGRIVIGNNGGIGFDPPDDDLEPVNAPIPANGAYMMGRATLAYWDNIGNGIGAGRIYLLERPGDELIIQWNDKPLVGAPMSTTVRFQIKIFNGATFIFAQYIYDDIERTGANGGVSATIGFQAGPPGPNANDFEWSFNQENAVEDGTVLSVIQEGGAHVPTMSEWGLIALASLLLVAALLVMRRHVVPAT